MADVRGVKVSISLDEYTRLAVMESNFNKVKGVIESANDRYLDAEVFALLKLLCCDDKGGDVNGKADN